jgi:hypothetical protein
MENLKKFKLNFTMSDIQELEERCQYVDDGEQEIVFSWGAINGDGDQCMIEISVGDD